MSKLASNPRGSKAVFLAWQQRTAIALTTAMFSAPPVGAQTFESLRADPTAGSAAEWFLIDHCAARARIPIGIRPFGPQTKDSLLLACGSSRPKPLLQQAPAWARVIVNTERAAVLNEGPVWAGRGVTVAASGGIQGRWRRVSYAARPIAFWSQNLRYNPSKSIAGDTTDYRNPWFGGIDFPYRFGDDSYARFNAGETYLRADWHRMGFGISNVAQIWGPARLLPLLLSANAGGFPHAFLETGLPLDIGIGQLSARWILGRLRGSSIGPGTADQTRLASALVGVYSPRGFDGLELGATRFFHVYDTPSARDVTTLTLPLSGFIKNGAGSTDDYNQLASVFIRLAPTASPLEAYAEYYREDHSADLRDLLVEPDHQSAYMVGLRGWRVGRDRRTTLTMEASNSRFSHLHRVRAQGPMYVHGRLSEGHTLRGLPLGSPTLPGGGSIVMLWERRSSSHGWTIRGEVARLGQSGEGGRFNQSMTGYYSLAIGREFGGLGQRWIATVRAEPGFGDVPGTNVGSEIRVVR